MVSLATGELFIGDPKTAAGRSTVAIPDVIIPEPRTTWQATCRHRPTVCCSPERRVGHSAPTFSTRQGTGRVDRRPSSICTFMICATAATLGRQPPARVRPSSRPGWDTQALQLRCDIRTPRPIAIGPSRPPSARLENRHCLGVGDRPSRPPILVSSSVPSQRVREYWGAPAHGGYGEGCGSPRVTG